MLRPRPSVASSDPNVGARCQKCLQAGHWTFDCKNERIYQARLSRTALLANPELRLPEANLTADYEKERQQVIKEVLGEPQQKQPEPSEEEYTDDETTTDDETSDYDTDEEDALTSDYSSSSEGESQINEGEGSSGSSGYSNDGLSSSFSSDESEQGMVGLRKRAKVDDDVRR